VIDRSQREKLLKEIQFSNQACSDVSFQLQMGKLLAVDEIFIGSIGKVRTRYVVNMKMLKVETTEAMGKHRKSISSWMSWCELSFE
jgi:hypothetical protein